MRRTGEARFGPQGVGARRVRTCGAVATSTRSCSEGRMPTWVTRWRYEMSAKPVRPGIWRLRSGGFFVRSRVTDRRTGRRRTVSAVLRETTTPAAAQRELDRLVGQERGRADGRSTTTRVRWSEFAASLFEEKVLLGRIKSAATREWWAGTLEHYLIPAFGHFWVDELQREDIEEWIRKSVAKWMSVGRPAVRDRGKESPRIVKVAPVTVNGWLRILRTVCHAAKKRFKLPESAFEGVEFLEEPRTYTHEQPNALLPEDAERFLDRMMDDYPQWYAMTLLGFATGSRPSSLRPLRKSGPDADIKWDEKLLLVRRSHSRKGEIMDKTKTGKDLPIGLPVLAVEVLRWHVKEMSDVQKASELLFPSESGGLRSRGGLKKPFDAVAASLGLAIRLTPRGMRRTFVDSARLLRLPKEVRRSISGHSTDEMEEHYSTALHEEQRTELSKVLALIGPKRRRIGSRSKGVTKGVKPKP